MRLSKRLTKDLIWTATRDGPLGEQIYTLSIGEARQILDALKIKYVIPNWPR